MPKLYTVFGLAVGETHEEMYTATLMKRSSSATRTAYYLMGIEYTHWQIMEAVDRGIDFFDCVYPSRNGRHGHVYTKFGKINLFNAQYERMTDRLKKAVSVRSVKTIQKHICHLLKAKEMLGMRFCIA